MPLFDTMYYDQKWSLWDTWPSFGRNVRAYVVSAARRIVNVINTQNRRANVINAQNRRSKVINTGG